MASDETDSVREERAESTEKAFESPAPGTDTSKAEPPGEAPGASSVGDSVTRHGEDVAKEEQEAGRYSTGTDGTPADRPTGESTPRDMTSVDPDDA